MLLLLLCCCAPAAYAVAVKGLYTAAVPVASRAADDQQQALQMALQQVLAKVSGNPNITQNPNLQTSLANANNYVQQYGYIQKQDAEAKTTTYLQATFNKQAVNDLLTHSGQAIWGNNRPLVLVWLAVAKENNQETFKPIKPVLLSNDSKSEVQMLLQNDALASGLPIMLPILDLQDMQTLTANDVLAPNMGVITDASSRYGSDAIVVASIIQDVDNQWQSQWLLQTKSNQLQWHEVGSTMAQVMRAGVNDITSALSARYAVNATENTAKTQQVVKLIVTHISNLDAYAEAKQYLSHLALVQHLDVEKVEPSEVVFNLQIKSDQYALMQALSLDHMLKQLPPDFAEEGSPQSPQSAILYYQWIS